MEEKIPEYWKNLSLENIIYFNEEGIECVEEWRDVKGYEGLYQISNCGRIKSLERYRKFKMSESRVRRYKTAIIKGVRNSNRYIQINLCKDGVNKIYHTHVLVATYFIKKIIGKYYVNHKDGDKSNPIHYNLEWNTSSENAIHAIRTGLAGGVGESNSNSKLKESEVKDIFISNLTITELSKVYNVTIQCIYLIKKRKNWKQVTNNIAV